MRFLIVLSLLAVAAIVHADGYQINQTLIDSHRYRGLQRTVIQLENHWTKPISYAYSLDKEECWSWSVSATVLRTFSLGSSTHGCQSTGTYSTSGTLDSGYTLRVMGQPYREYETYYLERIYVRDGGSSEVIDSTYATYTESYEHFYRTIHN